VFRRIIDASDDAQVIVRCVRKMNHAIDTFVVCELSQGITNVHNGHALQLKGMIQIELGVIVSLAFDLAPSPNY
jgi:hypothetical protein